MLAAGEQIIGWSGVWGGTLCLCALGVLMVMGWAEETTVGRSGSRAGGVGVIILKSLSSEVFAKVNPSKHNHRSAWLGLQN